MARGRRAYAFVPSESDGDDDDDDDSESGSEPEPDSPALAMLQEMEDALVNSAMARIRRAQAKGNKEVKLNKEELGALERRRKRMQEESRSASASERRKRKEQRYAVPISQLEPTSRKHKDAAPPSDDALPRHVSADAINQPRDSQGYPPMGYFPPPSSATRSRPRSATSSSQRPPSRDLRGERERGSSPFRYTYVQPNGSTFRHVSDTAAARPRSSRGPPPPEDAWASNPNLAVPTHRPGTGSRQSLPMDPFRYMTGGSPAPYHPGNGAAAARRYASGPPGEAGYAPRGSAVPAAARAGGRGASRRVSPGESAEETEDDDEASGDDFNRGAPVAPEPVPRTRSRDDIVVEVERDRKRTPEPAEPPPARSKKSSASASSPSAKRKGLRSSPARKRKGR